VAPTSVAGPTRENPKSATFARNVSVRRMLDDFTSLCIIGLSAHTKSKVLAILSLGNDVHLHCLASM
jgi:hypothetical protein